MHEKRIYTFICDVYECVKWGFMLKNGSGGGYLRKSRYVCWHGKQLAPLFLEENSPDKRKQLEPFWQGFQLFVVFSFVFSL